MKPEADILEEVRRARETVLAGFDFDIRTCAKVLNAQAVASGRKLLTRIVKPKHNKPFRGRTSRLHREAAVASM
jgi:hypothetical protein